MYESWWSCVGFGGDGGNEKSKSTLLKSIPEQSKEKLIVLFMVVTNSPR